ncbi:PH domain-containing protein [Planomicrobium sp. CPCC 101079]|uniref:PH domain-containing protein n=1 Tax=Planomicrobium sp. CPCC 101079 TaxID=2599618 RepID=UPI001647ACF1|nr:PH domain-containing protein [Planomicrobium sp. CPCC 101079]
MTTEKQRYHPSSVLFQLYSLLKGSFFIILYLFVLRSSQDTGFWQIAKAAFLAFLVMATLKILLNWMFNRYELSNEAIVLYNGIFVKKQRTIGFKRIQNVQQTTNFLHRLLKLTSLTLETGTSGDEASVRFPVLAYQEADRIKGIVEKAKLPEELQPDREEAVELPSITVPKRQIYFTPSKKDLIKAAFTSFSVLAIFPILFSLYFQIDDFFNLDNASRSVFHYLTGHLWLLLPILLAALLLSAMIGFITTYSKYGKFEISADEDRIYIKKGVFTESIFSIQKDKVQAIKLEQPFLKRMLGMVEVKLLSAGNVGDEAVETNSLFPFLPIKDAHQLVKQLLPSYEFSDEMKPLPKNTLWLRLLRPYYFWIIATAALLYFKMEWAWLSAVLLVFLIALRIADFRFTQYAFNERFVQIRKGAFVVETFITKRVKIQEIEVTQGWLQRKFGVASLHFHNRGKPLHISVLQDVPNAAGQQFYLWFKGRSKVVKL